MRVTMSAQNAAEYLGLSYWTLLEKAKRRQIPHVRFGSRVLFRKETLDAFLTEQESLSLQKPSGIRKLH